EIRLQAGVPRRKRVARRELGRRLLAYHQRIPGESLAPRAEIEAEHVPAAEPQAQLVERGAGGGGREPHACGGGGCRYDVALPGQGARQGGARREGMAWSTVGDSYYRHVRGT